MRPIRRRRRDGSCRNFIGNINPYYVSICKQDGQGLIIGKTVTEKQYNKIRKILEKE